jgi:hypothetical protein
MAPRVLVRVTGYVCRAAEAERASP